MATSIISLPNSISADNSEWKEGNTINGIYKIEKKIDEGNYGQVWRVRNLGIEVLLA